MRVMACMLTLCLTELAPAGSPAADQGRAGPPGGMTAARATRRDDLVGAWRLKDIQVGDATGSAPDPFYGAHPAGLIIYDRGGYFSVQIASVPRPAGPAKVARAGAAAGDAERADRARVLDGYYAYYGRWEFDAVTSQVTHHVERSLFPVEEGGEYVQRATVDGTELVFSRTTTVAGREVTQRKIWEKAP